MTSGTNYRYGKERTPGGILTGQKATVRSRRPTTRKSRAKSVTKEITAADSPPPIPPLAASSSAEVPAPNWRVRVATAARAIVRPETLKYGVTILELLGIPIAIWALLASLEQTSLTKEALINQRIVSAWQILAVPGGGSTGKGYALETLINLGQPIRDADLTCIQSAREVDDDGRARCVRPTDLSGMKLKGTTDPTDPSMWSPAQRGPGIFTSDFSDVSIIDSTVANLFIDGSIFDRARLERVSFVDTVLRDTSLVEAQLLGVTFEATSLVGVDFTHADLRAVTFAENGRYEAVNISGATFCYFSPPLLLGTTIRSCKGVPQSFLDAAWFYEDDPPLDLFRLSGDLLVRPGCPRGTNTLSIRMGVWTEGGGECPNHQKPVATVIPEDQRHGPR